MYDFNAERATKDCIEWIKEWFEENGKGCKAVIGISGGKDSTIVGKLLVEALGKDNVIGVQMPNKTQSDMNISNEVCEYLGIQHFCVNIGPTVSTLEEEIENEISVELSSQSTINLPPRIRMATLYAVSQSFNGRVVNTCNYSEDYVGYATRYGDSVGDFSPISDFTVTEVKAIGRYLEIPDKFIDKVPSDGLCGKTDEDNLGFTYEVLDKYLREGIEPEKSMKELIDSKHMSNLFKLRLMDSYRQRKTYVLGKEVIR